MRFRNVVVALVAALGVAFAQGEPRQLPPPSWMADAVIYQVFTRNFTMEGTLAAASARLEYVRDLGVNTVYLLPFYPSGEARRKGTLGSPYAVRDYMAVDAAQGSLEDFRAFVEHAHQLGLRVVIDVVFNHTAWDNPLVTEHPAWFLRDASGAIRSPRPEWTDVAALDTSRADVQDYLIGVGRFWLREGVDGFRADVSGDLPLAFWQRFRRAVDEERPDVLLIAETGAPALHDQAFDLSYDWRGVDLLVPALNGLRDANRYLELLQLDTVPKLRYLENHDQERFAERVRGDPVKLRAAAAVLLTEPGVPLIYAGQEVGLRERPSLFDADPLAWSDGNAALRAWYVTLLDARARLEPLRRGGVRLVPGQPGAVMAFARFTATEKVVVLVNLSSKAQVARLPWAREWRDALTERRYAGGPVPLEAGQAMLLLDR